MPAGDQGSIQHLILRRIPVDVLANMITLFSTIKELECQDIHPPQEVQCVHMYSVDLGCSGLLYQSLFDSVLIMDVITYHLVYETALCKVTLHFGGSSVADVYRYVIA